MNPTPSEPPAGIILRPARLASLSTWPSAWREAWGRRANELQDAGVPWPEHEVQAFDEMAALKAKGGKPPKAKSEGKRAAGAAKAKAKAVETTGKLNLGGTK